MPAVSDKQRKHLEHLNALWQTEAHRFRPGGKPWNLKHRDLPRNANRHPLVPCQGSCETLVSVYGSGWCRRCSNRKRREDVGTRTWKSGYVYKEGGSRPRPEHIVIAERALGRPLKSTEHVHHINMDRKDNRNENLLICSNSYHRWLHHQYELAFARSLG